MFQVLMFICITATCFNWATNVDMLMAVVIPTRRNAANSWQILISHLCGDASGPYILGLISDAIRGDDDTPLGHFHSLVMSFYLYKCSAWHRQRRAVSRCHIRILNAISSAAEGIVE
ncbi:hypothetical protein OSTOST_20744 [Ostertagia ostertagi]